MNTRVVERYLEIVDELLLRRALEDRLSDDDEERFAEALNDCWIAMTAEQHALVERSVAKRRELSDKPSLGLIDAEPRETDDDPVRVPTATAA